ncbi:MAG TPA: hypothetical protein VMC10_13990 [Stellaceae bacterium]|nr:hypothetical protein [Stellaceae bacterium]
MVDRLDTWQTAKTLVDRYGSTGATLLAMLRADRLHKKGDIRGSAVWQQVLRTVSELTRTEHRTDEPVS